MIMRIDDGKKPKGEHFQEVFERIFMILEDIFIMFEDQKTVNKQLAEIIGLLLIERRAREEMEKEKKTK